MPTLRACGLSAKKAESLRAARAIATGTLSERVLGEQSTADALRTLTELPGIGPWSANLVLLRGLGRLEVFSPGDRGVALALQSLLHLSSARELDALIEKLGGERGLLYFACSAASCSSAASSAPRRQPALPLATQLTACIVRDREHEACAVRFVTGLVRNRGPALAGRLNQRHHGRQNAREARSRRVQARYHPLPQDRGAAVVTSEPPTDRGAPEC